MDNFRYIFKCLAGSNLYGTNTSESDKDIRGVFIPTSDYFLGFANKIEQIEDKVNDITLFDIRKFMSLCVQCNPNIVELLFVPADKVLLLTKEWQTIQDSRDLFLSKKARYTFSGYAVSQLHRIKQHRNWLLNPPKKQPMRSDFGLPENKTLVTKEQLNAYDKLLEIGKEMELDLKTMQILDREKAFQNANREWGQYQSWKQNRNPKRAKLEEKHGFDTKYALHLYRLITEGRELLLDGYITFPRPDASHLLDIKNGKYTYDELMEMVGNVDEQFNEYYEKSTLPSKPNIKACDQLCIDIVRRSI